MRIVELVCVSVFVSACGGSPPVRTSPRTTPEQPPPTERWETVAVRTLVHDERCASGSYEFGFPARADEFGRRFVVEVYGSRIPFTNQLRTPDWRWQSAVGIPRSSDDQSRCRLTGTAVVDGPALPDRGSRDDHATAEPDRGRDEPSVTRSEEETTRGGLRDFDGPLPGKPVQVGAVAWLPQGNPWFYADELYTTRHANAFGLQGFRFVIHFHEPVDMEGVVIRLLDQRLQPTGPRDEYVVEFARRVAWADAKRKARRPEIERRLEARRARIEAECAAVDVADRDRCRLVGGPANMKRPPLRPEPRPESRPPAPTADVYWVPGYWTWDEPSWEWVWLDGTYVVDRPRVAATPRPSPAPARREPAVEPAPTPAPAPRVAARPRIADEPREPKFEPAPAPAPAPPAAARPRTVDERIRPQPARRREVIPPPPRGRGLIWVPGHWRLAGSTWRWVPGTWKRPPRHGSRYRAPVVKRRGKLRIYIPGRWLR